VLALLRAPVVQVHVEPMIPRCTVFCALLMLAPVLSCSGGGGGDLPFPPQTKTLAWYNNPSNPRPSDKDYISVNNVIIMALDQYDETNNGAVGNLYVQDMGVDVQPYSGITVYNPSYNPPDMRVFVGDVVDVRSPYMEFLGPSSSMFPDGESLPELSGANVKFRFESPVQPPPKVLVVDELYEYSSGRKWIGVYVELQDVPLRTNLTDDGKGRFSAQLVMNDMAGKQLGKLPKVANSLYPIQTIEPLPTAGMKCTIRGIVQYFYSFSITPRSADDIFGCH
jgi:hypothetical protein